MIQELLFQIDATADPTFWERVADQAFSIILLVAVTTMIWNKYSKLEHRLTRYMDEDRQRMLDVIERNTRVMEKLEDHLDRR